jgi:hypothetical protein
MLLKPKNGSRTGFLDSGSFWGCYRSIKFYIQQTTCETSGFFRWQSNYKTHSSKLVTALQQWSRRISFTSCEYSEGKLEYSSGNINPGATDIDFIEYAMKHLEKSYTDIYNAPNEVENKCRDYCNQITEVMTAESKPSFQSEVIRALAKLCPGITRVRNIPQDYNWYLDSNVFKMLFEQIRDGTTQSFSETQHALNIVELLYNGSFVLMRGDKSEVDVLKLAITTLIGNNEIRDFVSRFQQLKAEMLSETTNFRNRIQTLRTMIDGGNQLNTPGDCNLDICRPNCG